MYTLLTYYYILYYNIGIYTYFALWAHKATHVLYHTNHWKVDFLTEVDLFSHVHERDLLGCGHNDGTVHPCAAQVLDDREMLVGRTRGRVYNEVVNFAPVDVTKELFY